jgi:GNAT superfamily N-acetyltransferase
LAGAGPCAAMGGVPRVAAEGAGVTMQPEETGRESAPVERRPGAGGPGSWPARLATPADALEVARLLDAFNREFDTHTPGPEVLAARLRALLGGDSTFAVLAGSPAVAVALVTLRPNVWYDGPVALLDELYVAPALRGRGIGSAVLDVLGSTARTRGVELIEINVDEGDRDAQRFYERHGFAVTDPDSGERALYCSRERPAGRDREPR